MWNRCATRRGAFALFARCVRTIFPATAFARSETVPGAVARTHEPADGSRWRGDCAVLLSAVRSGALLQHDRVSRSSPAASALSGFESVVHARGYAPAALAEAGIGLSAVVRSYDRIGQSGEAPGAFAQGPPPGAHGGGFRVRPAYGHVRAGRPIRSASGCSGAGRVMAVRCACAARSGLSDVLWYRQRSDAAHRARCNNCCE